MTDVLVYWPDYQESAVDRDACRWHSNHRLFGDLLPGDRLWVVTPGKSLGLQHQSAGYLVGMWPIAAVIENPGRREFKGATGNPLGWLVWAVFVLGLGPL